MTDYEYDENLPYVAENDLGFMVARFVHAAHIKAYLPNCRVIDTTPKPRVPGDAKFVTWCGRDGGRWFAERTSNGWEIVGYGLISAIENLPGVTPDTVLTVLDAREEQS